MSVKAITVFLDWENPPKELLREIRKNIMNEFPIDRLDVHFETIQNTHGISHARIEYSRQVDASDYESNAVILQDIIDSSIDKFERQRDYNDAMDEYNE